jgi:hypothetical protein
MADWDADSDILEANLREVLHALRLDARERVTPTVEAARIWQQTLMRGLTPPNPVYVGRFRGEAGLEGIGVRIGQYSGTPSQSVAGELQTFERALQRAIAALDRAIEPGQVPNADQLAAVIDLCAWAHSGWVRIHPFANGNGRTARLWANYIAMRYDLPAFVRLRPRPEGGYANAATEAMKGRWQATVPLFRQMYREAIRRR